MLTGQAADTCQPPPPEHKSSQPVAASDDTAAIIGGNSAAIITSPLTSDSGSGNKRQRLELKPRKDILFKEGTRLEARDRIDNKWWSAKVLEVDNSAGEVLLHFHGWNVRHDEWINMDSTRLRPASSKKSRRSQDAGDTGSLAHTGAGAGGGVHHGAGGGSTPFKEFREGDEVMAQWNKIKYPAKIVRFEPDGSYLLEYYDGIRKKVLPKNIRKLSSDDAPFIKSCHDDLEQLKEEWRLAAASSSGDSSSPAAGGGGRKRKAKFSVKEVLNLKTTSTSSLNKSGSTDSPSNRSASTASSRSSSSTSRNTSGSRTRSPQVGSPPPEAAPSPAEPVKSSPSSSSSSKSSPPAKPKPAANLNQSSLSPVNPAKRKRTPSAAAKRQLKDGKLLVRTFKTSVNKVLSAKADAKGDGVALVNGSDSIGIDKDIKKSSSTKTKKSSSQPNAIDKKSSLLSTVHKKSSSPVVTTKKSSFSSNCDTIETSLNDEVGISEDTLFVSKQDHELCNGELALANSTLLGAAHETAGARAAAHETAVPAAAHETAVPAAAHETAGARVGDDCGHGLPQPVEKENQPTPGGMKRKSESQDVNTGPNNSAGAIRKRKKKAAANFDPQMSVKSEDKSPLVASSKLLKKGVNNSSQVLTSKMSKTSSISTKSSKRRSSGVNNHVVKTASNGGNNKIKKIGGSGDYVPQRLAEKNKNHSSGDISYEDMLSSSRVSGADPTLSSSRVSGADPTMSSSRVSGADPTLSSSRTSGADLTLFPYLALNFDQSNEILKAGMVEGVIYPGPAKPVSLWSTRLPEGWKKMVYVRTRGITNGKWDVYMESPEGAVFRSKVDLSKHFEANNMNLNIEDFDFLLDPTMKRIRSVWRELIRQPTLADSKEPHLASSNKSSTNLTAEPNKSTQNGSSSIVVPNKISPSSVSCTVKQNSKFVPANICADDLKMSDLYGVSSGISEDGVSSEIPTHGVSSEIPTHGVSSEIPTHGVSSEALEDGVRSETPLHGVSCGIPNTNGHEIPQQKSSDTLSSSNNSICTKCQGESGYLCKCDNATLTSPNSVSKRRVSPSIVANNSKTPSLGSNNKAVPNHSLSATPSSSLPGNSRCAGVRCNLPDCNKLFRNGTLLLQHVKHYHSYLSGILEEYVGNSPTVTDMAYLRTRVGDTKQEFSSDEYLLEIIDKARDKFDKRKKGGGNHVPKRSSESSRSKRYNTRHSTPGTRHTTPSTRHTTPGTVNSSTTTKSQQSPAAGSIGGSISRKSADTSTPTTPLGSPRKTETGERESIGLSAANESLKLAVGSPIKDVDISQPLPPIVKSAASSASATQSADANSSIDTSGLLSPSTPLTAAAVGSGSAGGGRRRKERVSGGRRRSSFRENLQAESQIADDSNEVSIAIKPDAPVGSKTVEAPVIKTTPTASSSTPGTAGQITPPTWKRRRQIRSAASAARPTATSPNNAASGSQEDGCIAALAATSGVAAAPAAGSAGGGVETMTEEELVQCVCRRMDGDGLMVQCEVCLSWQHGHCTGFYQESQVPEKYICLTCKDPPWGRERTKYMVPLYWGGDQLPQLIPSPAGSGRWTGSKGKQGGKLKKGKGKSVVQSQLPIERLAKLSSLMSELSQLAGVLHSLKMKLRVAEQSNHPKVFMWSSQWESPPQQETSPTPSFSTNDTSNNLGFLSQASAATNDQPLGQASNRGLLVAGLMDGVNSSHIQVGNTDNATNNDALNAAGSSAMEWTDAADKFFSQNLFFDNQTDNSGGNAVGALGDSQFNSSGHNGDTEIGADDDQYLNSVLGTTNDKSVTETASGLINKLLQYKESAESTPSSTAASIDAVNTSNSKVDKNGEFSKSDDTVKIGLLDLPQNGGNGTGEESNPETLSNVVKDDGVQQGSVQGVQQNNGVLQGSVQGVLQNDGVLQGSIQGDLQNDEVLQGSVQGVHQNNGVLQGSIQGVVQNNGVLQGSTQGSELLNIDKLNSNQSIQDPSKEKAMNSNECMGQKELIKNGESVKANDTKSHNIQDLEDAKSPLTCDDNSGCSSQTAATINNIRSSIDSEMSSSGGSTTALADTATAEDFPDFDSDLLNEVKQLLPGVLQDISQSMNLQSPSVAQPSPASSLLAPPPLRPPPIIIPEPKLIDREECRLNLLNHLENMQGEVDVILEKLDTELTNLELLDSMVPNSNLDQDSMAPNPNLNQDSMAPNSQQINLNIINSSISSCNPSTSSSDSKTGLTSDNKTGLTSDNKTGLTSDSKTGLNTESTQKKIPVLVDGHADCLQINSVVEKLSRDLRSVQRACNTFCTR